MKPLYQALICWRVKLVLSIRNAMSSFDSFLLFEEPILANSTLSSYSSSDKKCLCGKKSSKAGRKFSYENIKVYRCFYCSLFLFYSEFAVAVNLTLLMASWQRTQHRHPAKRKPEIVYVHQKHLTDASTDIGTGTFVMTNFDISLYRYAFLNRSTLLLLYLFTSECQQQ